ncbi:MAG: HAD-IA family hydrolase [Acidimicrobiales bacterium]|nr:HAD-IA family hydrolase [Acidimicrobiales bacterium]|tara:strand:+ start:894 stop:1538 length:645 start_codon:yes stop_codon:yes gene_type:complete
MLSPVPADIEVVLFDFGGVLLTSPFDAFAAYEAEVDLPQGTVRRINSTNPDDNAWARFERRQVDAEQFGRLFEAEAAAQGYIVDAARILEGLHGTLRPTMVEALRRCSDRLRTGMLTNNITPIDSQPFSDAVLEVVGLFDEVIQSSVEGCRKPEPRIYEIACERLGVEPVACVFLDDLGINLKPARSMGMTTIKVVDPEEAIGELEAVVGFPLR